MFVCLRLNLRTFCKFCILRKTLYYDVGIVAKLRHHQSIAWLTKSETVGMERRVTFSSDEKLGFACSPRLSRMLFPSKQEQWWYSQICQPIDYVLKTIQQTNKQKPNIIFNRKHKTMCEARSSNEKSVYDGHFLRWARAGFIAAGDESRWCPPIE